MRPLDPRLLRNASAARRFLAVGSALGLLRTVSTIAFCWFATAVIVGALHGATIAELGGEIAMLAIAGLLRAAAMWLGDLSASWGSAAVKSQLRRRVVERVTRLGPGWLSERNSTDVVTTTGSGLDALDDYFTLYLPQLILTAVATPLLVLVMLLQDVTSGIIVALTLPIIPLFMILIGRATEDVQQRQWRTLARLSRNFLDVVNGLATLKIFGRQHRQSTRIAAITESYRVETMKVLRFSFLSGFALELAATLSVALVAVSIGLRLVSGGLGLEVGLFVLLLAPEVFLPIRQVGAAYHAAANGIAAAEGVFEILEADGNDRPAMTSTTTVATAATAGSAAVLRFADVTVSYDGRTAVHGFSAEVAAGRFVVLAAPSGAGKSSLVSAMLGFVPFTGEITVGGDPANRLARLAWSGQRAHLVEGTVAENVALGADSVDPALVDRALRLAGAGDLSQSGPVSVTGTGLSGG